jgi:bifunctional non-homologous end joining protein LigD
VGGVSDFNGLHSRRHDDEVQLCAFDILALDDEDLRKLPLTMRKTNLARLLARARMVSSSASSNRAKLDPTYFAKPASLVWKAWSPTTEIAPIAPAARRIGSR